MFELQRSVVRSVLMSVAAGLLACVMLQAQAQVSIQVPVKRKPQQESHARRETNATRLARIQREIAETYSHRYEIFGGGGYLRFRSGEYTKNNNEVSWATALNYYLDPKFSIVGDARGSFGDANAELDNTYGVARPQINEYTFMGGASYRFYRKQRLAISVQGLGGVGWGIFSGGAKGLTGTDLGLWPDGFKPAFSAGVVADYNLQPNLAIRVTPTYVGTTFGGTVQNNVGINAGIVYRFGHQ